MKRRIAFVICLLALAALVRRATLVDPGDGMLAHGDVISDAALGDAGSGGARLLDDSWEGWRPATCMPDHCFCERVHGDLIRQPVNTWSNLGFVLTGLLILAVAGQDVPRAVVGAPSNLMRTRLVYPAVYAVAAVLIGVGSILYHSSLAFAGQAVDVISMYLMTTFMVLYNLSRLRRVDDRVFVLCYLGANVGLGYASIRWPLFRRHIFMALVVGVLVTEMVARRARRSKMKNVYLCGALASLVAACGMWILDITHFLCWPDSWFQGHALWHVLMAAVIGSIYFYYRSEASSQNVGAYANGHRFRGRPVGQAQGTAPTSNG